MFSPDQEIAVFKKQLSKLQDRQRAQGAQQYLKHNLKHYGVTTPKLHSIAKDWLSHHPQLSINQLVDFAGLLWQSDWHEERTLAVMILESRKNELTLKHITTIEHMINTATSWAYLDGIAVWLVGTLLDTDPKTYAYLKKWIQSDNFWVRRTALLAQITQFRRGRGDLKLFETFALSQFPHEMGWDATERFFIRKAIGWALRERALADPQSVFKFVTKHQDKMSGLTFREATRKLPESMKKQLNKLQ